MSRSTTPSPLPAELYSLPGLELTRQAPLARLTTFRIGGPAELLAEAHDEPALLRLLAELEQARLPWFLLGLGSNLLVPDEGLRGVVVRLTGRFEEVRYDGRRVHAGAAVPLPRLAQRTVARGLSGLEALAGFPSTVGGAVVMNAGCYGTEIRDVLVSTRVASRAGQVRELAVEELEAGYRSTCLQDSGEVVLDATFALRPGDAEAGLRRIRELNRRRWSSLPRGRPNVGSIFRNPPGDSAGRLIDVAGLKGLQQGKARISPKHGNVIVNEGGASARDVLALMVAARRAVADRFGIELEPEVVLTGDLRRQWRAAIGPTVAHGG